MENPVTPTTYQNQFDTYQIARLLTNLYLINNPLDEIHYHHLIHTNKYHLDEDYYDETQHIVIIILFIILLILLRYDFCSYWIFL